MGLPQHGLIELDADVVEGMVSSGQAVLVDVREPEEFVEERISGSLCYPMSDFEAGNWPSFGQRKTIIMCLGGVRSAAIARKLLETGHGLATHLKGGLNAWKEAGLPTEGQV